jgi:hypothetical protein
MFKKAMAAAALAALACSPAHAIDRISLKYDCLYVDMIGTDMDHHIINALQRKQDIYEAVMGSE